jgi:hypothetical protein
MAIDQIIIDASTQDPVQVLVGALEQPNRIEDGEPVPIVVVLCVDLDLTGHTSIVIGDNRSLIASPDCARGPRSFGPLIFVTDSRPNLPLFEIQGDNVRLSGFRLQGPNSEIVQGGANEEIGIQVSPIASAEPIHNIEISNMEIYFWSGSGIEVKDNQELAERGRLFNTNPGAVRIKGNFIHHNRHGDGFGYGVVSSKGAYMTIEQNVFDENRHAIAGESRADSNSLDYSGYTARDNLILPGGGKHCPDGWKGTLTLGFCWQTHQIDMHGDGHTLFGSHDCGTAGETIIIERNTILYTSGTAIKIRGNPVDKAVVDDNIFKADRGSGAISQNGACGGFGDNITNPIDVRPNNVFGVDPTTELGTGDFFGDGQEDQFMATGVTWWAKSPVTDQWRYLNTMSERLPQLLLGDFDNDGTWDVALAPREPWFPPSKYSEHGTGPWVEAGVIFKS